MNKCLKNSKCEPENICSLCGKENSAGVGMLNAEGGLDHSHCWEREHPPLILDSLYQVARGGCDPIIAAEVISKLVPEKVAKEIVEEYNLRVKIQWERSCVER